MKILIGIQARSQSKRFPHKIYEAIDGTAILERCYLSGKFAALALADMKIHADAWVLGPKEDEHLNTFCTERLLKLKQPNCDENDLFERYGIAAHELNATHIIRITADCPLLDPGFIIDIAKMLQTNDYASNTITRTFMEGSDVQGCSYKALLWMDSHQKTKREHLFLDFDRNEKLRNDFIEAGFVYEELLNPQFQFLLKGTSIDTKEDLERVRAIYDDFKKQNERMATKANEHPRPRPHLTSL